ncbi:MAG TPA: hypothetical protein VMG12_05225, partial [Polyangiaceae bacterium]|nr:hypothetical protein [Polyangiaceae bacterium]
RLDGAALDAPPFTPPGVVPDELSRLTSVRWVRVSESGERVLSVENSGFGFRWSAEQGVLPLAQLPGFPDNATIDLADLESGALVVSRPSNEREPLRLWLWTDAQGARELNTLPDQASSFRRSASLLRAAGSIIIGDEAESFDDVAIFRWSAERGTERVSPPSTLSQALYANADGTTIVGQSSIGVQSNSFRWTSTDGTLVIPEAGGTSLIALGGDVLLAAATGDASDAGAAPPRWAALKYGAALAASDALPIELIATGLTPARAAVEQSPQLVSENARLLAGTTSDARGTTRAWMLSLRDSCDTQ